MSESEQNPGAERAVGAPRRPTADPRRFLVPEEHLPPGFAASVESGSYAVVRPRPASTVVLAREGESGVEVLLLRRPQRSGFAAGAWVFPGGRVDAADADPAFESLVTGPSAEEWARRLRLPDPSEARGYVIAALREAWEETGILVGEAEAGTETLLRARRSVLDDAAQMAEVAATAGIRFHAGDLLYIAHWITPEPEPRRYDTRFFLARVGPDEACELHGEELAEARWFPPAQAVEGFGRGELMLLPPTVDTLRRLARFGSLAEAWGALRGAEVPAILPRMRREADGVVIEF